MNNNVLFIEIEKTWKVMLVKINYLDRRNSQRGINPLQELTLYFINIGTFSVDHNFDLTNCLPQAIVQARL